MVTDIYENTLDWIKAFCVFIQRWTTVNKHRRWSASAVTSWGGGRWHFCFSSKLFFFKL